MSADDAPVAPAADEGEADQPVPEMSEDMQMRAIIHYGDLSRLKEVIESGKRKVNQADDEGCYLLQWAALDNHTHILR